MSVSSFCLGFIPGQPRPVPPVWTVRTRHSSGDIRLHAMPNASSRLLTAGASRHPSMRWICYRPSVAACELEGVP